MDDKEDTSTSVKVLAAGFLGAAAFTAFVFTTQGFDAAADWFTCYVIEYSLSIDNLFVFLIIFDYFKVEGQAQAKCLNFGIWGAVVLRFLFIFLGAQVLANFQPLILFFAAILLYASYKGFTKGDEVEEESLEDNFVVKNVTKVIEVSKYNDGDNFFTKVGDKTIATPVFVCLLTIEFSDVVFATDSVPAVLGITGDAFIAYTSNVFAIFGLRSLFFLLKEAMVSFTYLEPAVNVVLGYVGAKIIFDYFDVVEVPTLLSLSIVLSILLGGVGLSLLQPATKGDKDRGAA